MRPADSARRALEDQLLRPFDIHLDPRSLPVTEHRIQGEDIHPSDVGHAPIIVEEETLLVQVWPREHCSPWSIRERGGDDLGCVAVQIEIASQLPHALGIRLHGDNIGTTIERPDGVEPDIRSDIDEEISRVQDAAPHHHLGPVGGIRIRRPFRRRCVVDRVHRGPAAQRNHRRSSKETRPRSELQCAGPGERVGGDSPDAATPSAPRPPPRPSPQHRASRNHATSGRSSPT